MNGEIRMKITICDRCKKEFKESNFNLNNYYISKTNSSIRNGLSSEILDLCPACYKELIRWLKGE